MSLYLGKIHYWLYNKILWAERIEEDIIQWAEDQKLPAGKWKQQNAEKYGQAIGDKPLEEIIDTSNIHGWLHSRIQSVELRLAALITAILGENPGFIDGLIDIYKKQGAAAAREYGRGIDTPEEVFNALNDFILEGMPCDRVNEIISSSNKEFVWQTTECLHKPFWEQVKGNVRNFHTLREAWIKSFAETLNPLFTYERTADGRHTIAKKREGGTT